MLGVTELQKFIDDYSIVGEILEMDLATPTVEAAANALGVLPQQIVKSILFTINSNPILTVLNGTTKVDRRVLAKEFQIGRKKIKLSPPDEVLDITGFAVGSMPPFGHRKPLMTFIDPAIMEYQEVFAGGGSGSALLRITPKEIHNFSQGKLLSMGLAYETK
jgi:prolyl-tRNA editing enzyme YbaK/EbsC (Cys-tRNA(Pro) deacylase)